MVFAYARKLMVSRTSFAIAISFLCLQHVHSLANDTTAEAMFLNAELRRLREEVARLRAAMLTYDDNSNDNGNNSDYDHDSDGDLKSDDSNSSSNSKNNGENALASVQVSCEQVYHRELVILSLLDCYVHLYMGACMCITCISSFAIMRAFL